MKYTADKLGEMTENNTLKLLKNSKGRRAKAGAALKWRRCNAMQSVTASMESKSKLKWKHGRALTKGGNLYYYSAPNSEDLFGDTVICRIQVICNAKFISPWSTFSICILLAFDFKLIVWKRVSVFLGSFSSNEMKIKERGRLTRQKLFDTLIPFHQSNRFLSSFGTWRMHTFNLTTVKFKVTKW